MTANSELNQNWVGCTVSTPRTQVVSTLRTQCPGRGRCSAHNKQVVSVCALGRVRCCAQLRLPLSQPQNDVATPTFNRPGHDLKSMSRHPISTGQVTTSNRCRDQPLLLPQKRPCRDPKPWSRHHFSFPAPSQVATPKPGRDPPGD